MSAPDDVLDDLDQYVAEQRATSPEFAAAYDDTMARHRILDALVVARRRAGLSQQTVAERMGVKQPTVSQFETESSDPALSTVQRYARAVGWQLTLSFWPADDDAPKANAIT